MAGYYTDEYEYNRRRLEAYRTMAYSQGMPTANTSTTVGSYGTLTVDSYGTLTQPVSTPTPTINLKLLLLEDS